MMLTTSLPLLPPGSSSLLPQYNPITPNESSTSSTQHAHHGHHNHPARRPKPTLNPRSTLALLSTDEREIVKRKMAIAMYGYSWLKPAGCTKTMLGRREEEVEREEVERQLREVEMQERLAVEAEEQERLAHLQERGEVVEEGERDLDDDVPEAEDGLNEGEEDDVGDVDLDDDVPEAEDDDEEEEEDDEDELEDVDDSELVNEGWVYDTRREPDTDEEDEGFHAMPPPSGPFPPRRSTFPAPGSENDPDDREAQALANAMLDEDEMGEMSFQDNLDGADMMDGGERDLDDEVPDADEGWEHTDTELDESEMDISILPAAPTTTGAAAPPSQQRQSYRRSSGLPPSSNTRQRTAARTMSGNAARNQPNTQPRFQPPPQMLPSQHQSRLSHLDQTPMTSSSLNLDTSPYSSSFQPPQPNQNLTTTTNLPQPPHQDPNDTRRSWLNATGARRNLFGLGRAATAAGGPVRTTTGISGRLFTPSPIHAQPQPPSLAIPHETSAVGGGGAGGGDGGSSFETPLRNEAEPQTPRRSGRLLAGLGRRARGQQRDNNRARDSLD